MVGVSMAEIQGSGRPRLRLWSEGELQDFRSRALNLLEMIRYSPEELDSALGYSPLGRMTRQILRGRQPSRPYVEKFGRLEIEPPPPKPQWLPRALKVLTGEAIPVFMVEGERKACLECVALQAEGKEVDVFFFPSHPSQVVHKQCRKSWRRRRDWFRRCEQLRCRHVVIVEGMRAWTCVQQDCPLRRKPWHEPEEFHG